MSESYIKKSVTDKRLYRGLSLQNHMKVLLISDKHTDKAAAALDVNVGNLSDPDELPGLAHFCEHMLFLGTQKYPAENEYTKFLSEHGGSCNAFTQSDHTNYYFDVHKIHFREALDRFAQFFLCPLFTESSMEKEVNAVHSEYEKNKKFDFRRFDQVDRATSKNGHAYRKFGTGNKQTLDVIPKVKGIDVREELLKFHEKWYSANIMSLVILGHESLEQLEWLAVELFSGVINKRVEAPSWPEHPWGTEQVKLKYFVVPIMDIRLLNISFPIPDYSAQYKSKPCRYIDHLLGHEGPGSLLSALRSRGWCNSLRAGEYRPSRGFGFCSVNVDLTVEGIDHVDDIVKLLFQYINMLRQEPLQDWIYEEELEIMKLNFHYKSKEFPIRYVSRNAQNLQYFPVEDVLFAHSLLSEWRPDLINEVLSFLTPDNIRVKVVGKTFEPIADLTEEWYGTKYKQESISEETIENWKLVDYCDELKLPERNEFIPTDVSLFPCVKSKDKISPFPSVIKDTPRSRVWFKQDDEFVVPKSCISFEFVSPLVYLDPISCNLTSMYVWLFKDSIIEYVYAAGLAGLHWNLFNTTYGIILRISGYNNKQSLFLANFFEKFVNFKIDPKRYEIIRESYIRSLKNSEMNQPNQNAAYYMGVLLAEKAWTTDEVLAATEHLSLEEIEAFIPQILSKMHIECLIHGNVEKATALQMVDTVENILKTSVGISPLLRCQVLRSREVELEDRSNFLFKVTNTIHTSSCVEIYYQTSPQSTESNMLLQLLVQIITEPCFNVLRTTEQLGYLVHCSYRNMNGGLGLRVVVQSGHHPSYVDTRVELFLASISDHIKDMSDEDFERHREALALLRLEKPESLSLLTGRFWLEIITQQYNFDRATVEVTYLRTITKQRLVDYVSDLIRVDAPRRHKLAVHVMSMAEGGAGTQQAEDPPPEYHEPTLIHDITSFKSSQGMFPIVQPFIKLP